MRRNRRFRYDWDDHKSENTRPERERLGFKLSPKILFGTLMLGIVLFFLEKWLSG